MIDALIDDANCLMETADSAENGEMVAVWLKIERKLPLKKYTLRVIESY